MDAVYQKFFSASPVMKAPVEKPPRMNSSAICRSLPAQKGQEPCIERTVRFGAMPTPSITARFTRYWRLPKTRVCWVAPRLHTVRL